MDKKHTIILLVIGLLTLIATIMGATFAYFASTIETNNNTEVSAGTSAVSASFMATSTGGIDISVDAHKMSEASANDNETINELTDEATLSVILSSAQDDTVSTCTYDIVYNWGEDSDEYIKTANVNKEFTIRGYVSSISGTEEFAEGDPNKEKYIISNPEFAEINIDELTWVTKEVQKEVDGQMVTKNEKYAVLVKDAKISSFSKELYTRVNWNFEVKFYNVTRDQSDLKSKNFGGFISVDPDSIKC